MLTVSEFIGMCIEPSFLKVELYDTNRSEVVFFGSAEDIPERYEDVEVESYDVPTKTDRITLNIDA